MMNTVIGLRSAAGTIHGFACQLTFSCGVSFLRSQAKTQPIGNRKKNIQAFKPKPLLGFFVLARLRLNVEVGSRKVLLQNKLATK